ncbi:response regulator [Phenylobacterium sp.]|uniref:response regulator n=1 Tax=Phenylobacterium sp. TaxID=1871053 RepID=UPI002735348F|nr:response regulator [Phenylobacterium sp.]MDP3855430.1 response regulator [Phenylobacterium sp.]
MTWSTPIASWSARSRWLTLSAGLILAFAASVVFGLNLTRGSAGVATIWLASGIMTAAMLLLPRRWAVGVTAVCFGFQVLCNLPINSLALSFVFPLLCLVEAVATAWLARKACGQTMRLTSLKRVARLILLAVAPATAAVSILAADVLTLFGRSFNDVLSAWFYAHALGMTIVLPATLMVARDDLSADFRRSVVEQLGLYGLIAVASVVAFLPYRFPMPLLMFPFLTLMAVRLGPRGAALSALILATICSGLMLADFRPITGATWSLLEKTRSLQFLIAVAFFTSLAMALAIADQQRLKRLWAGRTRVARGAQGRAVAAGQAKTEFLATMSHEIRTPMNSIVGFTEVLLRRDDLPEPARRQLSLIERASASLLTVVNDVLDFSKMEAGGVELSFRPVTPRAIAQDSLAIVAEAARRKGLDLQLGFIGPVERPRMIDDLRVRQVLLNLLSNAIKFTEVGKVRLDVQVRETDDASALRFTVTDTGVGVPSDKVERLFKRFSQVDSSVSRAHGGTGLGLAICKGLTELMGGRIGVESGSRPGSVFWFEIPAPVAEVAAPSAVAAPAAEGLGARVLLVDDHPMNRELGATVLGLLGCEVVLAENGEEAVEAARAERCDLILMDVHMPRMDGLEATRQIRALGGPCATVPIIAMSADVMPEMEIACLKAGMNDAVGKPIQIQALHAVIAKWLEHAAAEAAA